jgi:hypothetical protein
VSISSDLSYPEFRVFPETTLNSGRNEFAITGFSISNQRDHLWWRWYMPSFAEKHLHGLNLTIKHQVNHKFLCHLRMIGMMSSSHEGYEPGGYGSIKIFNISTPIIDLECYYLFVARSPRVAVYCPIHNSSDNQLARVGEAMCSQFMFHLKFYLEITLLPSHYPPPSPPPRGKKSSSSPSLPFLRAVAEVGKKDQYSSVVTIREKEEKEFGDQSVTARYHHSNHRIAFAVQVFANSVSFAHMHIFLQHYGKLDFTIVIFDRFGLHSEIVKQYFGKYDIRYHPYTLLQVIEPEKYNDAYKAAMVSILSSLSLSLLTCRLSLLPTESQLFLLLCSR